MKLGSYPLRETKVGDVTPSQVREERILLIEFRTLLQFLRIVYLLQSRRGVLETDPTNRCNEVRQRCRGPLRVGGEDGTLYEILRGAKPRIKPSIGISPPSK